MMSENRDRVNRLKRRRELYQINIKKELLRHKEYREKHRDEINKRARERREREREEIKRLLGNKCFICGISGDDSRLHTHEIHGKEHNTQTDYVLKHIEDFIKLCVNDHKALHRYALFKSKFEKLEIWMREVDMRLNALEARMRMVDKRLIHEMETEKMTTFIEDLPDIRKGIVKALTRSKKSIRTTGKYKGRGKEKKKEVY